MFCVESHCFKFCGFQARQVETEKSSTVYRIIPTIFLRAELRTDFSLQRTGYTPLKPSLAITKRTNLKLLEDDAADDTMPTSVEEDVIQPTHDDDCHDTRADSFQSVSVQTLVSRS
ncbi:uncharacterized protein LOC143254587 [Tachypleus tridentatus]|uniref:uncharacterized protein LOC143254587 n=1 Tax=Tachypleus tridentatus TaxID=6853 RepID=UPI003FD60B98